MSINITIVAVFIFGAIGAYCCCLYENIQDIKIKKEQNNIFEITPLEIVVNPI